MPFETVVAKTVEYLGIPSVVGHEQHFLQHLLQDFENLGLQVIPREGTLEICGGSPKDAIISAHADRHGLISIGEGEYAYAAQYMKEIKYGENNQSSIATLKAISERFADESVFAYDPKNGQKLGEGKIQSCIKCMENGDSIFYVHDMEEMKNNIPLAYGRTAQSDGTYLKGQIDNTVSLGVIYTLFQNGFQGTALLTTEEEIGYSWKHMAQWLEENSVESQRLIILDTSPYNDPEPIEDSRIILRNRDKSAEFNPELLQELIRRCNDLGLPHQLKDEYLLARGKKVSQLGSTELGRLVQNCDNRWNGATIQIPTLEYHTSYETTTRSCIESYYALLSSILIEDPIDL